jgi:predicted TIM-barrel fold metal-dependent hydrolase
MIIDAHAHAASEYRTVESILEMSKKYGICKIVLCTSPKNNPDLKGPPNLPFLKSPDGIFFFNRMVRLVYHSFLKDSGNGNQYVFELSQKVPGLVIQFLWVNPLDPQHMRSLERNIQDYQVSGIKLHQAWDAFTIGSREFNQLVEVAKARRLPIFIHLYSKEEARKLLRFTVENPGATFIIGHMLGLDFFKEERGKLPNVYFDTSGSERVRGKDIQEAVDSFGYDHVIFGSDTPYARIEDQIAKIERMNLPDSAKEHIFRLNFEHLMEIVK